MALKLTNISLTLEDEKPRGVPTPPHVIVINAEKKKIYGEDDRETGEEKWKVRLDPRYSGSMEFSLTGEDLDGVLDDLVTYRGLIRKIEHILGDAERNGG